MVGKLVARGKWRVHRSEMAFSYEPVFEGGYCGPNEEKTKIRLFSASLI